MGQKGKRGKTLLADQSHEVMMDEERKIKRDESTTTTRQQVAGELEFSRDTRQELSVCMSPHLYERGSQQIPRKGIRASLLLAAALARGGRL
jgi:hypothetical protein